MKTLADSAQNQVAGTLGQSATSVIDMDKQS